MCSPLGRFSEYSTCASLAGFGDWLTFPETLAAQRVTNMCPGVQRGFGPSMLGKEVERVPGAGDN